MEGFEPLLNSDNFKTLAHNVQERFKKENELLKTRLKETDLICYFFTDGVRGANIIRVYLETSTFQLFTAENRQYGPPFLGLCTLFMVSKSNYCPPIINEMKSTCTPNRSKIMKPYSFVDQNCHRR